jgi:pimeloyl-ACP methyl ester carboxylesterase
MAKTTTKPARPSALKHLRPSDLRAAAQLATQATHGVTRMAEGVHHAVLGTMGLAGSKAHQQTSGVTGFVYRTVHGVTELVGKGLHATFTRMEPMLAALVDAPPDTPEREAVLAALNGVLGDQLEHSHNPLATPMTLRYQGRALNLNTLPAMPNATGKVLLMIHGLCMNEWQWTPPQQPAADGRPKADIAATLTAEQGYTPVYLRYNTGRHTSQNGRELAAMLELLLARWPTAVQELTVVVHSMGGLVIRSAIHTAQQESLRWPQQLKSIVFLGTPHHGAPLERAGNWIDVVLGATPFSKPFAKLGQLRSSGITDLRYGFVQESDWAGKGRFTRSPDRRQPLPLPQGVVCYTLAATLAKPRSLLAERLLGDGLVPLRSALGQHDAPAHNLHFAKDRQTVVYRMNHMEMLCSPVVCEQVLVWLGESKR